MKQELLTGVVLVLLVMLLMGFTGAATAVTHDVPLAQIPSLYTDNATQADGTFVGAVADSEFFIGLVVQSETIVVSLGSTGSSSEEKGLDELVERPVTQGTSDGQQTTTLGEVQPPPCESTKAGCGGSTGNCDALRGELAAADRVLVDLEKELAQNGVQNLRDHPAISAAKRHVSNLSGQTAAVQWMQLRR